MNTYKDVEDKLYSLVFLFVCLFEAFVDLWAAEAVDGVSSLGGASGCAEHSEFEDSAFSQSVFCLFKCIQSIISTNF